nr:MAG TPA: hypothetical protein [Caudoviricetes sp.]
MHWYRSCSSVIPYAQICVSSKYIHTITLFFSYNSITRRTYISRITSVIISVTTIRYSIFLYIYYRYRKWSIRYCSKSIFPMFRRLNCIYIYILVSWKITVF